MTFDDELKLRLDWAVSVKQYNLKMIAQKDPEPPIAEARTLLERYPQHARRAKAGAQVQRQRRVLAVAGAEGGGGGVTDRSDLRADEPARS